VVQCVNLMLRIFECRVLLFDCFFTKIELVTETFFRVWAFAGEVEDIIIGRLTVVS